MSISIVIPTLNEAGRLAETIAALRLQQPGEIIVVDGGSSDATPRLANKADVFLQGPRGRALQMNLGAAHATANTLLFLHADCLLESGALEEAERLLERRTTIAGCYSMSVRARGWLIRSIAACATARVRFTGLAYGGQGLFIRREQFQQLGGFPLLSFMEDLFFSKQLRRLGRIVVARRRIFVSPRRWQREGLVRQTLRNWTLTALAAGGIDPDRLAALYPVLR